MPFRILIRSGPRVERLAAPTLSEAIDLLEGRCRALAAQPRRRTVNLRYRTFEPLQQVAARAQLRGPERWRPTVRAGVDVRGDGSAEAWTGLVRRELVAQEKRESPYDALRRVLSSTSVEP